MPPPVCLLALPATIQYFQAPFAHLQLAPPLNTTLGALQWKKRSTATSTTTESEMNSTSTRRPLKLHPSDTHAPLSARRRKLSTAPRRRPTTSHYKTRHCYTAVSPQEGPSTQRVGCTGRIGALRVHPFPFPCRFSLVHIVGKTANRAKGSSPGQLVKGF